MKIARLQVLINNQWEYVFCHNAMRKQEHPVITKDKYKALRKDALDYFKSKYPEHNFRVI